MAIVGGEPESKCLLRYASGWEEQPTNYLGLKNPHLSKNAELTVGESKNRKYAQ
jgi:hypothetical protein